eukprot:SAG11_NODE_31912_length_288_cov_0.582011_2_plen_73_part_01
MCLVMLTMSTECFTYAERIAKKRKANADRAAKIAVCSLKSWLKQRQARGPAADHDAGPMAVNPEGYVEMLSAA